MIILIKLSQKKYQLFSFFYDWTKDDLTEIKKLHFIQEENIKKLISNGESLIEISLYINEEDYKNDEEDDIW